MSGTLYMFNELETRFITGVVQNVQGGILKFIQPQATDEGAAA